MALTYLDFEVEIGLNVDNDEARQNGGHSASDNNDNWNSVNARYHA